MSETKNELTGRPEADEVSKEVTDKYSLRGRVFNRIREDILSGKYAEN